MLIFHLNTKCLDIADAHFQFSYFPHITLFQYWNFAGKSAAGNLLSTSINSSDN